MLDCSESANICRYPSIEDEVGDEANDEVGDQVGDQIGDHLWRWLHHLKI